MSPKNDVLNFTLLRTCGVKPTCKKCFTLFPFFIGLTLNRIFSSTSGLFLSWNWKLTSKNTPALYQNTLTNFTIGEIQDHSPEKVFIGLMWRVEQKSVNWIVALLNYALTVSIWFQVRDLRSVSTSTTEEESNTHTISWEKENWNQFKSPQNVLEFPWIQGHK